jgi:hypothetical protein
MDLKGSLFKKPYIKVIGIIGTTILSNLLTGVFLIEITSASGKLEWKSFYASFSFYLIAALAILLFLYYRALYLYENDILNFGDPDYLSAHIMKECLAEMVKSAQDSIKNGNAHEVFKTIDQLRKRFPSKR